MKVVNTRIPKTEVTNTRNPKIKVTNTWNTRFLLATRCKHKNSG